MNITLVIGTGPIDESALARQREPDVDSGAVLVFQGVVRRMEAGREIAGLEYEAFEAMARQQFHKLFETAASRWPLKSIRLVHRTGFVRAGEASLWLEVIAGHRQEAFAAGQWIVDEMKRVVPIWKKAVPLRPIPASP